MFKSWLLYWASRRADRLAIQDETDEIPPRNREKRKRDWLVHKRGKQDKW